MHPVLATLPGAKRVLVLGGGDGLAVREILKYPNVESVTLVDLDPAMTRLFSTAALLRQLNGDALNSPKVKVINADAARWLEETDEVFDFMTVDFPDPTSHSVGKLYTTGFYRLLAKRLSARGRLVVQATSPFYARALLLDRGGDTWRPSASRPRPTMPWCPASANGASSPPAASPTCRRNATTCRCAS